MRLAVLLALLILSGFVQLANLETLPQGSTGGVQVEVYSPVPFYVNGSLTEAGTYHILVNSSTLNLTFQREVYSGPTTRSLLLNVEVNGIHVNSTTIVLPGRYENEGLISVRPNYLSQFLVRFLTPIQGYVNGTYALLQSGWYNKGTLINVPEIITLNESTRIAITGNFTGIHSVDSPIVVADVEHLQHLITLPFPLVVLYKGIKNSTESIWVDNGTYVVIDQQVHYTSNTTRLIFPRQVLGVNNQSNLVYYTQYFVDFSLPLPGQLNGVNSTLSSGWYNSGDNISLYRIYYVDNSTRLVVTSNLYRVVGLEAPLTISGYYVIQYRVNVTGVYGKATLYHYSLWEPNGSTIVIPQVYLFQGVVFLTNSTAGHPLMITSPLNLTYVYHPSGGVIPKPTVNPPRQVFDPLMLFSILSLVISGVLISLLIRR
jgi:hypothetical protein